MLGARCERPTRWVSRRACISKASTVDGVFVMKFMLDLRRLRKAQSVRPSTKLVLLVHFTLPRFQTVSLQQIQVSTCGLIASRDVSAIAHLHRICHRRDPDFAPQLGGWRWAAGGRASGRAGYGAAVGAMGKVKDA
uniref:Uncharacterized protein n=1 Tax=Mycena chlorophos TaxID=658473 RepID=A0ABQ0L621_MYCCL|nr:predicted protein [Mycena chlorophos]